MCGECLGSRPEALFGSFELKERIAVATPLEIAATEPLLKAHSSLNNLSPGNRALGYRRVIPLIGIAPIPNRGCGCVSIRGVTIAVIESTVVGSHCYRSPE
jgi:hypothetical protein